MSQAPSVRSRARLPRGVSGLLGAALLLALGRVPAAASDGSTPSSFPIRVPTLDGWTEGSPRVLNLYSQEMLLDCVGDGDEDGLLLDLSRRPELLDGSRVEPSKILGTIWIAPFPVCDAWGRGEAVQFRRGASIREGRAGLKLVDLENGPGWIDRGQVLLRTQLTLVQDGPDRDLGTYEFLAGFRRDGSIYRRAVTVVEGPFVGGSSQDPPASVVIWLRTDSPAAVTLLLHELDDPDAGSGNRPGLSSHRLRRWQVPGSAPRAQAATRRWESPPSLTHEIAVAGLRPDQRYSYAAIVDGWLSGPFVFRTAPRRGEGTVRFAFAGDSRQGPGGGSRAFMGVNAQTLGWLLNDAAEQDVRFWVHGGDLVSGYTGSVKDFRTQLRAFKWIATPFLRGRPIFSLMGNHDSVIRVFADEAKGQVVLDRWPYLTESSEAVFADEFVHPTNAPALADARRPSYRETVYSFQCGPVEVIALNNNYWVSSQPDRFGGSPEGFIQADELEWLRAELRRSEQDPTIRHVFLCMQEPPLPNSVHLDDAMWYEGDARVRGSAVPPGAERPRPEPEGVIETRNEVLRMAAASSKVVAILASDEHNYSRTLLTPQTPAGETRTDDRDGDGRLDAPLSPVRGLARPLWCLTSGGAGAPPYPEVASPWNRWWKENPEQCPEPAGCYRFSMLNHWLLFEADARRVSLEARSVTGDVIDRVEDLRAARR